MIGYFRERRRLEGVNLVTLSLCAEVPALREEHGALGQQVGVHL